ncbi:hypothetical protein M011DRAFT_473989 [Sporormia fimetaria CBS 119925]|uniref:Protein kinase domain-containing protein n=1 Tax=Sporormia fimetaria CBS 119925 TaxID=1340428 RepID=A0A6A6VNX1_9PLEO|nr:hypothetical protein M011DRAFT_473989 [Sporormia fimetaria CBS 119925]
MGSSDIHTPPSSCEDPQPYSGYMNRTVIFGDDSEWTITASLSDAKRQWSQPPFEATQVYSAVCIKDPRGLYIGVEEAVIKVKYQLMGPPEVIERCEREISESEYDMELFPDSEEAKLNLSDAQDRLDAATRPAVWPNASTQREMRALTYFALHHCPYTPRLWAIASDDVDESVDEWGMVGGYALFMLMPKLPGRTLTRESFWALPVEKREEIRQAFSEALREVRSLRINHTDPAMRNLMWDERQRKCYIIDYEEFDILKQTPDPDTDKVHYDEWDIAETSLPI